jgi:hypothetical protein
MGLSDTSSLKSTRPFWLSRFPLDRLGMMKVHQDPTPRILHRITHLDDTPFGVRPIVPNR